MQSHATRGSDEAAPDGREERAPGRHVAERCPARRPLRVAIVTETYPPEVNGVAATVARVVGGLRERGHELQLVRPRQGPDDRPDVAGRLGQAPRQRFQLHAASPSRRRGALAQLQHQPAHLLQRALHRQQHVALELGVGV